MSIKSAHTVSAARSETAVSIPLTAKSKEDDDQVAEFPQVEEEDDEEEPDFSSVDDDNSDLRLSDETDEFAEAEAASKSKTAKALESGAVVEVYKPECLSCNALVPFVVEKKTKKKPCHFSAGNEACPAKSVKIVIHVNVGKIVEAFLRCERTGNHEKLADLYLQLSKKSAWERERVTEALANARKG